MGHTPIDLRTLEVGGFFEVKAVEGPQVLVERLLELGLIPGEKLEFCGQLPLGGPWLVAVRGIKVALRTEEVLCLKV